ncbi:MAG: hypothetical protein KA746_03525 [Pyrinomonadaceae bacterium]|nr:hypothetical protein [Pyrinomonadaceae bacterium]MBP6214102.1 hypothetical protein [Pyrinomonadaceae bacterium]
MRRFGNTFAAVAMITAFVFGTASFASAQKRNDREIRDAVRSLSSKIDDFEYDLRYQMQSSSDNNDDVSQVTDDIRELREAVRQFQSNFDQRRENRDDVTQIITAARQINSFLSNAGQNRRVTDGWAAITKQIDRLGANYGISNTWDKEEDLQPVVDDPIPIRNNNTISVGLSGTYDLDIGRSESIDDVVSNSNLGSDQREDLKEKLQAPAQIAIDIRGNQVTLATSNASPVTITADGRDKTEQVGNGKTIRLRATLSGQNLTVSSLGGETDYTITFSSVNNGQVLKVSRRVTTDYLDQTVFAESVYNKTDSVARLGIDRGVSTGDTNGGYSDNDQNGNPSNGGVPQAVPGRTGDFVVPNGMVITAVLDNELNTKASQNNDRFRLTVQSPDEFRGATIEGYLTGVGRSGKVTGRSNITFNFEKITLRDGKTYDFAGNLQSIKDQNGKTVKIDNEGTAKGDSQTKESVKRGGLGAGLGALIGAIAGGAKGAVIGAVIGGGAGAGSVAIQGRDDLQLQKGSTISITSSSPIR